MNFAVGARVCDKSKQRGTVRYVGPVSISYKDPSLTWIGVEWDEDGRGKYDGSVTDKAGVTTRYFQCHPKKGSFIKPSKLSTGINFLEAVRAKYLTHDKINGEYRGQGSINISSEWDNHKKFNVELVGVQKIQRHLQMEVIDNVSLENDDVSHIEREPEAILKQKLPNIRELSLENTLLARWEDVAHLMQQFPKLQVLNLARNQLSPLSCSIFEAAASFNLEILVLNNTGITWEHVTNLAQHFPNLKELHLEGNNIDFSTTVELPSGYLSGGQKPSEELLERAQSLPSQVEKASRANQSRKCLFPKLQKLNLSYNGISTWSSVLQFSKWPALKHLMLNGNFLKEIEWPSSNGSGDSFFNLLQCISLSNNKISSWKSVDALNALPSLCALNFEGNVVGNDSLGPRQLRQLLIARIAGLATLNNSQVRRKERLDAEKQYIKIVLLETEKPWDAMSAEERASAMQRHPRIKDLIDTHGLPASFRTGAGGASAASALGMVTVTLRSIAVASATTKPKQQRLPTTMTVGSLKLLCARLFKIPSASVELVYQEADSGAIPQALEDDEVSLAYYGVFDGGVIVVHNAEDNKKKDKEGSE